MVKNVLLEKVFFPLRNIGQFRTALPVVFLGTVSAGGVSTGTPVPLASAATITFSPTTTVTTHTPTQNETINFGTVTTAGTEIWFEVVTSGAVSYTITFGTNTKNQGTLATGTTAGKVFIINFISDGTNWVEVTRTTAM